MKRYHTIVKIEKVRKELQLEHDEEALRVAKTIPIERIKNMSDFSVIAEAYFQNGEYETAKQYFQMIYEKTGSRRVLWQLIHTTIRLKQTEEAEEYLKKFIRLAPDDVYQYIFRYQLDRLEKKPIEDRIQTLEKLKKAEYMEHWVYELAKMYHKVGNVEKCVKECEDLILWFGQGEYVERAKALRAYYKGDLDVTLAGQDSKRFAEEMRRVLSGSQKEKILKKVEETVKKVEDEKKIEPQQQEKLSLKQKQSLEPNLSSEQETDIGQQEKLKSVSEPEQKEKLKSISEPEQKEKLKSEQKEVPKSTSKLKSDSKQKPEENPNSKPMNTFGLLIGRNERKKQEAYEKVPTYRELLAKKTKEKGKSETSKKESKKSAEVARERLEVSTTDSELQQKQQNVTSEDELFLDVLNNLDEVVTNLDWSKEATSLPEKSLESEQNLKSEEVLEAKLEPEKLLEPEQSLKSEEVLESKTESEIPEKIEEDSLQEELILLEELPEEGLLYQNLQQKQESLEGLFGSFALMSSVRTLLISNLERILQQKKARIIIAREDSSVYGQMELAKKLARALRRLGMISSSNTALIQGEKLNQISLKKTGQQLKGCCLIVDHVGALKPEKAGELLWFCRQFGESVGVILVDDRSEFAKLYRMKKDFESVFFSKFYLHKYSAQDWMALTYGLMQDADYEIEESAYRLFLERIKQFMQQQKSELLWETIRSYTYLVMEQTEIRNSKLLLDMSMNGKFEATELMTVCSEDIKNADKIFINSEEK